MDFMFVYSSLAAASRNLKVVTQATLAASVLPEMRCRERGQAVFFRRARSIYQGRTGRGRCH
jgi:hypothetical protein